MSHVQAAVLQDEAVSSSTPFTFLKNGERKRKILKDEKKLHGAVDESSLEQQFRKLDTITFVV